MISKKQRLLSVILMVLLAAALVACTAPLNEESEPSGQNQSPETQLKMYTLEGLENVVMADTMPGVLLLESGEAMLSQPVFSSLALAEKGTYEICDDEITVLQNGYEVVFAISDNGDTLTIISSTLQYAKVGAVYKYNTDEPLLFAE